MLAILVGWLGAVGNALAIRSYEPDDPLVAVIPVDYPPTYFKDAKTGEPSGLAVDAIKSIARHAGVEVEFIFGKPWEEIEQMLLDGRADVIPLRSINPKTAERFLFTDPLDTASVNWIVRRGYAPSFPLPAGTRVGVMKGGGPDIFLRKENPELVLVQFESAQEVLLGLLSGRVDAVLEATENLMQVAHEAALDDRLRIIPTPTLEFKRGLALRKNDQILQERLNKALGEYRISPEAGEHIRKWLSHDDRSVWEHPMTQAIAGGLFAFLLLLLGWHYLYVRSTSRRLLESDQRLKLLAENSRTYAWEVNAEGLYTYVSQVVANVLHYQPEELVGKMHFYDLHPESGRNEFKTAVLKRCARQEAFRDLENTVLSKDGRTVWFLTNGIPLVDKNGNLCGCCGSNTDISELKASDVKRQRQAGLITALLDSIPDIIFFKDVEGVYLGCNPPFAEFVGKPRDEIIGKTDYDLFNKEVADFFREQDKKMLEQGGGDTMTNGSPIRMDVRY